MYPHLDVEIAVAQRLDGGDARHLLRLRSDDLEVVELLDGVEQVGRRRLGGQAPPGCAHGQTRRAFRLIPDSLQMHIPNSPWWPVVASGAPQWWPAVSVATETAMAILLWPCGATLGGLHREGHV